MIDSQKCLNWQKLTVCNTAEEKHCADSRPSGFVIRPFFMTLLLAIETPISRRVIINCV